MSINRWMDKEDVVPIYDGILLSHKKNNEKMPFAATWMDLEKGKYHMYRLYVESEKNKKYKWTYFQNRNRLTDIENKLMVTKGERGLGVGVLYSIFYNNL